MIGVSVPTVPSATASLGTAQTVDYKRCSDRSERSDRLRQGLAEKHTSLSLLAARWRSAVDHDAAEAAAMAEHYAAPAGSPLPDRDTLTDGLLAGYRLRPSTPSPETALAVASGLHHHG